LIPLPFASSLPLFFWSAQTFPENDPRLTMLGFTAILSVSLSLLLASQSGTPTERDCPKVILTISILL
jgi:hypothetical protein